MQAERGKFQSNIKNSEWIMERAPFKVKFLPYSGRIHEYAKTLRGGMQREVEDIYFLKHKLSLMADSK